MAARKHCRYWCPLNSPPALLLTLLPFATNIVLKVTSSLLAGRLQKLTVEELLNRYRPEGSPPLLSPGQVAVLLDAIGHSATDITIGATLTGSVIAALLIALKSAQQWYWWIFFASILLAFGMWLWVHTRASLAKTGWFSLSLNWWVLIATCGFDGVLAVLSFIASLSAQTP